MGTNIKLALYLQFTISNSKQEGLRNDPTC